MEIGVERDHPVGSEERHGKRIADKAENRPQSDRALPATRRPSRRPKNGEPDRGDDNRAPDQERRIKVGQSLLRFLWKAGRLCAHPRKNTAYREDWNEHPEERYRQRGGDRYEDGAECLAPSPAGQVVKQQYQERAERQAKQREIGGEPAANGGRWRKEHAHERHKE